MLEGLDPLGALGPLALRRSVELPNSGEILVRSTIRAFDAVDYDAARAERYARREGLY